MMESESIPETSRLEPPQAALSHKRDFTQSCRCESLKTYAQILKRAATRDQRLAMGWTVRGSNSGGGRFSSPAQTGPGAHPASCTVRTVDHPPHLAPRLKKQYNYTFTFPLGLHVFLQGVLYF
jgi:hypothetical protein